MSPPVTTRRRTQAILDYAQIVIGSFLIAVGTNLFFVPNNVVSGGITGIAILAHAVLHTPVGLGVLALNIPLLYLGWRFAGGLRFFVRTAVAVLVLAFGIDLTAPWLSAPTHDRLLVICYGGLVDGVGSGLVFRGHGTTGGTDILARLARRAFGLSLGQALLAMNAIIFGTAAFRFGLEAVMVALALAFVSARVVDLVQDGFSASRVAFIVSREPERVRHAVLARLGRGLTLLSAEGGYRRESRTVLFVAVASNEVIALKRLLAEVDPEAFVTIAPAKEVLGEGFAPIHDGNE